MSSHSDKSLLPRDGQVLVAGIVARISGCKNQKELSLDDQVDHGKQEVWTRYHGRCREKRFLIRS
jgi:site-specific DNA recombinase